MEQNERKEYLFKEVDVIQDTIKRMASNSFLMKGWTVTLVVATLLLRGARSQVFLAFVPLIAFWYLDAFYLRQERLFRKLYEWVIQNRLKSDEHLLDMRTERFNHEVDSVQRIMISVSILPFYGTIAIVLVLYVLSLFCTLHNCCGGC